MFDDIFRQFDRADGPGACVLIVRRGKPLFAHGYGLADLERKITCDVHTNFRLASVTKQFTAMAILMLAARGGLDLDETLPELFPEFPGYADRVTVRHLLTHTSGVPDYEPLVPANAALAVLDQDVLRLLMSCRRCYFVPGSRFRYSNSAYALLALIVETRSGMPFARFLRENLFAPLGMDSTLAYEQGLSVVSNRAYGHSRSGKGFKRTDQSLTSSVLGDGGIYSSVSDLAKWDAALYRDDLVPRNWLRMAFEPASRARRGEGYGFGWYLSAHRGLREIRHGGDTIGFRTVIARYPEKRISVIVLANFTEARLEDLPRRIVDRLL